MKLSAQEEFGIRCLLAIAKLPEGQTMTIEQISFAEGITYPNVSKVLRPLRKGGFIESVRGKKGGYILAKAPAEIRMDDVLRCLGGKLYDDKFCIRHAGGVRNECIRVSSDSCGVRELWKRVQVAIDTVVSKVTLEDLLESPGEQELIRLQVPEENRYRERKKVERKSEPARPVPHRV